jgi:hypothetical protein
MKVEELLSHYTEEKSMTCQRCNSPRVAVVSSKASDLHSFSIGEHSKHGYLPTDMGVGGDYTELDYCLNCGQIQGEFPLPKCALERGKTEDEEEDEDDDCSNEERLIKERAAEKHLFDWFDAVVVTSNEIEKSVAIVSQAAYDKNPNTEPELFVFGSNVPEDFPWNIKVPFKARISANINTAENIDKIRINNVVYKSWDTPKKNEFVDLS